MSDFCLACYDTRKPMMQSLRKDLGAIVCGKKHTENFLLENDRKVSVCYSVIDEEPDDSGFEIHPKKLQVLPGKAACFKIAIVLHVPGIVREKTYFVSDGKEVVAELITRCTSLGPDIHPKHITMKFFLSWTPKLQTKRFELHNKSNCPVKFHIERPGKNLPFQMMQEFGEIQGEGRFLFDVRFKPSQPGVYCCRAHCLFQYHPPVLITFIGVYNPEMKIEVSKFSFSRSTITDPSDAYRAFMANLNEDYVTDDIDPCLDIVFPRKQVVRFADDEQDQDDGLVVDAADTERTATVTEEVLNGVLSHYYINVGTGTYQSHTVRLINTSSSKEFYFEWNNENGKHFTVNPKSGNLKEKQHLDLKIYFWPDMSELLYNGELYVRIFPLTDDGVDVTSDVVALPTTLNLSLIGHSFPRSSSGWLEQCEIQPTNLVLPACIPGEVVYATLLMKRSGHLPVTYQFIPPKRTKIKIKPPLGYITDEYQLFVVQFEAPENWDGAYTETWKIEYNFKNNQDRLSISSQVETPKLIFGENNVFEFATTLPGGMTKSSMLITNVTKLKILYEFILPEDVAWVQIPVLTGELEPLSTAYTDIVFTPFETKQYSDVVCCWTRSATHQDYKFCNKIELRGSCQDGFLVGFPSFHDVGKCLVGTQIKTKFSIFNFTPILMHFKLTEISDSFPESSLGNHVKLEPERGSIPGNTSIKVKVTVVPNLVGTCKLLIQCRLFLSNEENSPPFDDPRTLLTLKLESILPTYQIVDLHVEGGGPLISPDWLWKMMNINELNKILRTILPGGESVMTMKLPESAVSSSTMNIYMLVEAGSYYGVSASITNTYWKHFGTTISLELSQNVAFNDMKFVPSTFRLEPGCREVVKIELRFDSIGSSFYEWSLKLSLDRVVIIRSIVNGLPDDETCQVSMLLQPELQLKPVFIGDLKPPIQLFWLYNNTPNESCYVLDKVYLREASNPFPRIFNCLNGQGILPPYSAHPLMLVFVPNELREYEVRTHFCLKTDYLEALTISGSGILNYSITSDFGHEGTVPEIPLIKPQEIDVLPSKKVFTIKAIPTFSSVQRIFFLENLSHDRVWAYKWHTFYVEKLIHAKVDPSKGQIRPGEKILAKLTVTSYSLPTHISFSIPCDVVDFTALQAYKKTVWKNREIQEKSKDHFTITEKGITNEIPKLENPEKPTKHHIFVTIRTNVVADESIEEKLYPKDIQQLRYGPEVRDFCFDGTTLSEDVAHMVNETMERVIWNILISPNFSRKLTDYNERCGRVTYSQILPGREKDLEEIRKRSLVSLPKALMQDIMENTITDILCNVCLR